MTGNKPMITHWPADRITDDKSVEDQIYNAVLVEREACAKVAEVEDYGLFPRFPVCVDCGDLVADKIAARIRNRK